MMNVEPHFSSVLIQKVDWNTPDIRTGVYPGELSHHLDDLSMSCEAVVIFERDFGSDKQLTLHSS